MNNVGQSLINWLDTKGELALESLDEISTIPTNRIPGQLGYNEESLTQENRSQIDITRVGVGENLGIELNENQRQEIESNIGGSKKTNNSSNQHILAWYQPIHYFGSDWGIFLTSQGLIDVATGIAPYLRKKEPLVAEKLVYAAFLLLYAHEKFHHRMESFAIRLHVIEDKACYRNYSKKVYRVAVNTNSSSREEKLAMANMLIDLDSPSIRRTLGKEILQAACDYMKDLFVGANTTYSGAEFVAKKKQFENELWLLQSEIQEFTTLPTRVVDEWKHASQVSRPLFSISQNIWEITQPNQSSVLPKGNPLSVPRKKVERRLKQGGFIEDRSAGKGGHVKWRGPSGEMIILPSG